MGAVSFSSQRNSRHPHQPATSAGTIARLSSRIAGGRATACLVALWSSAARGAGDVNTMSYVSRLRGLPSRGPAAAFASGLSLLRRNVLGTGGGVCSAWRQGSGSIGVGLRSCCQLRSPASGVERERSRRRQHGATGAVQMGDIPLSGLPSRWQNGGPAGVAGHKGGVLRRVALPLRNITPLGGSRRLLATTRSGDNEPDAGGTSGGVGYTYGGNDPDNEEVPSGPPGKGWVSGVLSEDVMAGVVLDEDGLEGGDDDGADDEAVDMEGLKGGKDKGKGWVSFKMKDGVSLEMDGPDADPDAMDDDEDDMDARIRDAMASSPKRAVNSLMQARAEDYGFSRDRLNIEKLKISVPNGCCPGCGSKYQSDDEESPGFLPKEKLLELEAKDLGIPVEDLYAFNEDKRIREASRGRAVDVNGNADPSLMDPEAWLDAQPDINNSVEFDLDGAGGGPGKDALFTAPSSKRVVNNGVVSGRASGDAVAMAAKAPDVRALNGVAQEGEMAGDEIEAEAEEQEEEEEKLVVCQRCHKLRYYGSVTESLRPGFSDSDLLTPKRFLELLGTLKNRKCLVIYLVDLFDFHGSFLFNLPKLVGNNPVLVAGNKADLLPKDLSTERVTKWVRDKCRESGMRDTEMRDIHLVSCKMGFGLAPLMRKAREEALHRGCDIYVIGAANVGKSTFINHVIQDRGDNGGGIGNRRSGGRGGPKASRGTRKSGRGKPGRGVTVSSIPGTTLGFLKVDLGDRRSLFDTPGLLLMHTLTSRLNGEELRAVIPKKRVEHITLRLGEGKSVLIGGLARVDIMEGRPFMLTFFVSNDVRLHPTGTNRVQDMLSTHVGKDQMIFPPYEPGRLEEIGEQVATDFDILGAGWREAAADVVIAGLGWISVTGAGPITLRVWAPKGVLVMAREPLLPYESWETTSKFTGAATVKKGKKKQGRRV